jgi:hypothetical protein
MRIRRSEPAVLPQLEQMLTGAAAARVRRSPRVGGRIPFGAVPRLVGVAAACIAIAGTAAAATGVWNPIVGSPDHSATTSESPVPAALVEHLGVLRREQTPRDRSAEVEATLDGAEVPQGVRLESVRFLAPGEDGEAIVMLSGVKAIPLETAEEPVCVARPSARLPVTAFLCFGPRQLMSGTAMALEEGPGREGIELGVAPDGVATITAEFGSAPSVTVAVQNNYWEVPVSGPQLSNANGEAGIQRTVWRDAEGNVIPQAEPTG